MVLKNFIKLTFKSIALLTMTILFSCEEQPLFTNCEDCYPEEPTETNIVMKLDPNFGNSSPTIVTVKVYEGNLEDNILLEEYNTKSAKFEIMVDLNKLYTFTATYNDGNGNTYIAVDSATPRIRFEKNICEEACYWVYDKVVNLRIKYH